jgi:alginate O-acetyltransferase complex protein AlgI
VQGDGGRLNFADLRFWEILFCSVAGALLLRTLFWRWIRGRESGFDKASLMIVGLILLAAVSWVTLLIYLVVSFVSYAGLRWILKYHARHATKYLIVLVPLQLLPLFYYKYSDFVLNEVLGLNAAFARDLLIPVGISFYTFQLVGFVVDTLAWKRPLPTWLDSMNFAGFFPQLVAGPIERREDLLPQMERFKFRWLPHGLDEGAGWIVVGLFFKCCLADNLAEFFRGGPATNAYQVWWDNIVFGLRIYYDFAGYSLIAVGLGHCFGVRLTLNFTSPYAATSIAEFWRRWHITLSQWFRDYLYVPLGGGRVRWWAFNLLVVFLISGIWHGAGWNFVLWGGIHALYLIVTRLWGKRQSPAPVGWMLTMLAVIVSWLFFYETNLGRLGTKIGLLLSPAAYAPAGVSAIWNSLPQGDRILQAGIYWLAAVTLVFEWRSLRRANEAYALLRRKPVLIVLVVITILLSPGRQNGFIYFAF